MKAEKTTVSQKSSIGNIIAENRFVKKIIEMDKKVFLQRTGWFYLVLAGALIFVYGLVAATPMSNCMFLDGIGPDEIPSMAMDGDEYLMQLTSPLNTVCIFGCVLVLAGLLYKLFKNDKRRIFYISNMVYSVLCFVLFIGLSIGTLVILIDYHTMFKGLPIDDMNSYYLMQLNNHVIPKTSWVFPFGYFVVVFSIVASFINIFNICYKWKDFNYYMRNHEVPDSDVVEERM